MTCTVPYSARSGREAQFGSLPNTSRQKRWQTTTGIGEADGVSPGTTGLEVLISLIAFTAIYGTLAVVEFKLIKRAAQKGPEPVEKHLDEAGEPVPVTTVY